MRRKERKTMQTEDEGEYKAIVPSGKETLNRIRVDEDKNDFREPSCCNILGHERNCTYFFFVLSKTIMKIKPCSAAH